MRPGILHLVVCVVCLGVLPQHARAGNPAGGTSYVIGLDDVLEISYWREKELSAEVVVRPDGRIALPLVGEVDAAGLTPAQLTERIRALAQDLLEAPELTVTVKQINSRNVVITGEVAKPGRYALAAPTTVVELIAMAGGLSEFADRKRIGVLRKVNGVQTSFKVDYRRIAKLQDLEQNVVLQPGDIVVVP